MHFRIPIENSLLQIFSIHQTVYLIKKKTPTIIETLAHSCVILLGLNQEMGIIISAYNVQKKKGIFLTKFLI